MVNNMKIDQKWTPKVLSTWIRIFIFSDEFLYEFNVMERVVKMKFFTPWYFYLFVYIWFSVQSARVR